MTKRWWTKRIHSWLSIPSDWKGPPIHNGAPHYVQPLFAPIMIKRRRRQLMRRLRWCNNSELMTFANDYSLPSRARCKSKNDRRLREKGRSYPYLALRQIWDPFWGSCSLTWTTSWRVADQVLQSHFCPILRDALCDLRRTSWKNKISWNILHTKSFPFSFC